MTAAVTKGRGLGFALAAVLVTFSAQQLLTPLLAPLARELGLSEFQLGLVVTIAAAALTVMSPVWGRAVDTIGPRAVLLSGVGLAALGLAGFAAAVEWGLGGENRAGWTFAGMLLTRSLLFGAGIAAAPVVGVALAASSTTDEASRTKSVSLVGAAQGLSFVLGPLAGGALATVSVLLPLWISPSVLVVLFVVLAVALKPAPLAQKVVGEARARISPFDRRLLPILAVGFVVYLGLSMMIVIGFLVADRLRLDSEQTAGAVGIAFFVTGVVLVLTQGVVVPRLGWHVLRLLRVGVPIALVGFVVIAVGGQLWSITVGMALLAAGVGLAIPGYTTAATLVARPHEQGAVSGLVSANIGLTFMVGPVVGTGLYEVAPIAPLLVGAVLCVLAATYLYLAPSARRIGARAEDPADAVP
ncbi:MFS transporter [Tenggerimyces flavus]|uniref:MFS transporter n=1 Tax=Tenggerimyces flavus TaxID=1708749 RepID=A0ABV7YJ40_9ACTN|nr:MFS transporter [Tenggerimyces flavus]MBM7783874.1 MFS family permease [Tenggerimyces flavus]